MYRPTIGLYRAAEPHIPTTSTITKISKKDLQKRVLKKDTQKRYPKRCPKKIFKKDVQKRSPKKISEKDIQKRCPKKISGKMLRSYANPKFKNGCRTGGWSCQGYLLMPSISITQPNSSRRHLLCYLAQHAASSRWLGS